MTEETLPVPIILIEDCILRKNADGSIDAISPLTGEVASSHIAANSYILEPVLREMILSQIRMGATLREVMSKKGMPPNYVMDYWKQRDKTFKKELSLARKSRAQHFHDKAIEVVEESDDAMSKDELSKAKFQFEAYIRLAEMDNPVEFTPKAQMAQTGPVMPTTIIIQTGIDRTPIPDNEFTIADSQFRQIGENDEQEQPPSESSSADSASAGEDTGEDEVVVFTETGDPDFKF